MKLVDINGHFVDPTLEGISDALFFGLVKTDDNKIFLTNYFGEEKFVVIDKRVDPTETWDYDNQDEAYIQFQFLIEAYYQVGLPCL